MTKDPSGKFKDFMNMFDPANVSKRLCHVNSDEPNMLALFQIKQPQFRTIQ